MAGFQGRDACEHNLGCATACSSQPQLSTVWTVDLIK